MLASRYDETLQQRRERYLRAALESHDLASHSRDPEFAAAFRRIAVAWEKLAHDIEKR